MSDLTHSVVLGAGPMGRTIAKLLVSKGQVVTVVTRDGRSIGPGIAAAKADLSQPAQTIEACRRADVIYQCAAPPYHEWATGFPALQEAAIAAAESSGSVLVAVENLYGYGIAGTLHEDLPLNATTRKGSLRAGLSQELLAAHSAGRAKCVAGRATDFFGPGVTVSALGERFWPAILAGKTVDWVGDPEAPHSFAYLPDLAAALVALAQTPSCWGKAWHLPALPPITVREICDRATAEDNGRTRLRKTPSWLLRVIGLVQPAAGELVEMRYMFDQPFVINHSKFDQHIKLDVHSWDQALKETTAWWNQQLHKAS
ncbi:MAG: NAD-dependent epimerase/dehydratase family protein [Pseudomonadota bacterium]